MRTRRFFGNGAHFQNGSQLEVVKNVGQKAQDRRFFEDGAYFSKWRQFRKDVQNVGQKSQVRRFFRKWLAFSK